MKQKGIQYISDDYLKKTKGATPEQIIKFLEDYRKLYYGQGAGPSKPISIRVPQDLLNTFKKNLRLWVLAIKQKSKNS